MEGTAHDRAISGEGKIIVLPGYIEEENVQRDESDKIL